MKKWLEDNKVFFEVFSYAILGIMAVVVSITQWRTSAQEFELHKKQLLPLFKVSLESTMLDTVGYYNTKILKISNEGGSIKRFKCDVTTYYRFEIAYKTAKEHKIIFIPIADFFQIRFLTNNFTSELLTAYAKDNSKLFHDVYKYCITKTDDTSYLFVSDLSLVKISYLDINNDQHVEYYTATGEELSKTKYDEIVVGTKGKYNNLEFGQFEIGPRFVDSLFAKEK